MVVRGSSSGHSSILAVVCRCIVVGLRTTPVGSDGLENLVQGRQYGTLKCAQDEGSITGSVYLPASAVGAKYGL